MIGHYRKILISALLIFVSHSVLSADGSQPVTINFVLLISSLIGGLGLFLMGIKMMSDNLTKSTGNQIRNLLERLTHNKYVAFLIGIITTMVFQSSSATTVMLVSFVNSRLMKFASTVGIILGAAIGATVTIQLIAFRFTDYALTIVAVGFILYIINKRPAIRNISIAIIGFGILFLGMNLMAGSMDPLKSSRRLTDILMNLESPVTGILAGALFTAIIQSSSAFIGILIILGAQGLISLSAAVPLMIGANIGTAVTAIIASTGGSREAKQVALAHTLFKFTGAFIMVWFIPQLVDFVKQLTPGDAEIPRQIANSHTIFNTIIALLFLPFTTPYARLISKLLPVREDVHKSPSAWYINEGLLHSPALALSLARQEVLRMMEIAQRMAEEIIIPFMEKKPAVIEKIRERENEMNYLRDAIHQYLVQIIKRDVTSDQVQEAYEMMYAVDEFEQIGDILSVNLIMKAEKWCSEGYHFSEEGKRELQDFHMKTMKILYQTYTTFSEGDKVRVLANAKKSKAGYSQFRKEFFELEKQHYNRLKMEIEESVESSRTHMEIISSLKVIGSHATNIARILLKERKNGSESAN